jgi:hypothetical protein
VRCGILRECFADQAYDVALGRRERGPTADGSFALAAATLGVGDRLLGRHGRALGPSGFEVFVAQGITNRSHRGLVARVPDLEADRAYALPGGVCRAEKAGSVAGPAIIPARPETNGMAAELLDRAINDE